MTEDMLRRWWLESDQGGCEFIALALHATWVQRMQRLCYGRVAVRSRNAVGVIPCSAWKQREKYDTLLNPTA